MTLEGLRKEPAKNDLPLEFSRMDWEFESKTHPGFWHLVTVDPKTGELACGCKAYYYRHDCWHVRKVHEQRLVALKGYELQEADVPDVRKASKYDYVILVPKINLGREGTVHQLATVVYDLLQLGVTIREIHNWFSFLPESWTQDAVEAYVTERGRYQLISEGGNNLTGENPEGNDETTEHNH